MKYYDVVKKLIGEIEPVGETNIDNERFENLKAMTTLVDKLLIDIYDVARFERDSPQFSRKRAGIFASEFYNRIEILE